MISRMVGRIIKNATENIVFEKLSKKIVVSQRKQIAKMKEEKATREYEELQQRNKAQTDSLLKRINAMEEKIAKEKASKKAQAQVAEQKKIDDETGEIWDTI